MKLSLDTSAVLALVRDADRDHRQAMRFLQSKPSLRFVLTDLVLTEVATRLRALAGAERAVAVARDLLSSRRYDVLFVDADLLDGALGLMERFAGKRLSLTDCASFEVIRRLELRGAFTFDRDFRDCGFASYPED